MLNCDCLFCKIIEGKIPSSKVYEDENMLVFRDIAPKAKVHLLAVPKTHFALLSQADGEGQAMLAHIFKKIPRIAADNGCENGYRLVVNQGENAGQTVMHLHVHILGGQPLEW